MDFICKGIVLLIVPYIIMLIIKVLSAKNAYNLALFANHLDLYAYHVLIIIVCLEINAIKCVHKDIILKIIHVRYVMSNVKLVYSMIDVYNVR